MTVTVGASTSYSVLAESLQRQGYALHNLALLPHISVAGAIATATHGSGDRNEALSSAVAGLELVLADGSLCRVNRGDEGFDGMVVGLGAFDIVGGLQREHPDEMVKQVCRPAVAKDPANGRLARGA